MDSEVRFNEWTKLYRDGNCWIVLVGEDLQNGELYYSEDKTKIGAISKWLYEETNGFEGSAVEALVPYIIDSLVSSLLD